MLSVVRGSDVRGKGSLRGVSGRGVISTAQNGGTTLFMATQGGHYQIAMLLCKHPGIDVNKAEEVSAVFRLLSSGTMVVE